jgi:deazaflavin-dependent oxidoreductase (nitroreductase family)
MADYNTNLIDDLRAHGGHASGGPFMGRQVMILTTTGAKTGTRRETPLAYTRDGDHIVIVASKGGAPTHPAWYRNIEADPQVTAEVDGEAFEATATITAGGERQRLYDQHADEHASFKDYPKLTSRVIPVIVLKRKVSAAA